MDPSFFAKSIWRLADLYGPIFQLDMINRKMVVISNYELCREVLNDDKYEKIVSGGLKEVRAVAKDGLFTAYGDELACRFRTNSRIVLTPGNRIGLSHTASSCLSLGLSQSAACLTNNLTLPPN